MRRPFTPSRWRSARRPSVWSATTRVELLPREIAVRPRPPDTREERVLVPRPGHARGDDLLRQDVERRGAAAGCGRESRADARAAARRPRRARRASAGKSRPFGIFRRACPARPTRWRNVAIERVAPTWIARSTSPMSMPSSSEAVATSARSLPAFRRCSASSRRARERLPWWLVTASSARGAASSCAGDALGHLAGVHEDERRAVLADELRDARVDLLPLLVRADGRERRGWDLDREVELAERARSRRACTRGRRPRGSGPPPRAASAWPRGRCAEPGGRRGARAARATARDGCRACRGRARGSRRR